MVLDFAFVHPGFVVHFVLVARRKLHPGFSLLEVLVSVAVIALLLSLLLPLLSHARSLAYRAVCANNLRQINVGFQGYVQDNKDVFPQADSLPDWLYGGVEFTATTHEPVLAMNRPINKYLSGEVRQAGGSATKLFRCPSDAGIFARGTSIRGNPAASILPGGGTCYETYGNSYRANPLLMDSTVAGFDTLHRPLALYDILVDTSRLLVTADPAWYYATLGRHEDTPPLEASWHTAVDCGNMLAADGSLRFVDFSRSGDTQFVLHPRPQPGIGGH